MKTQYKFIPDIWISCYYEGKKCIGRTLNFDITNKEIVSIVNEFGNQYVVDYNLLENVRKINLFKIDKTSISIKTLN